MKHELSKSTYGLSENDAVLEEERGVTGERVEGR